MTKDEIKQFRKEQPSNNSINRMGCSENWYNPLYSISNTFTDNEIEKMSDKEIENLYKLAVKIAEGLY